MSIFGLQKKGSMTFAPETIAPLESPHIKGKVHPDNNQVKIKEKLEKNIGEGLMKICQRITEL